MVDSQVTSCSNGLNASEVPPASALPPIVPCQQGADVFFAGLERMEPEAAQKR